MEYVIVFIAGAAAAASALVIWYFGYVFRLRRLSQLLRKRGERLESDWFTLSQQMKDLDSRRQQTDADIAAKLAQHATDIENSQRQADAHIGAQLAQLDADRMRQSSDLANSKRQAAESAAARFAQLDADVAAFEARKIRYDDLVRESNGLKQDVFNLSVQLKKTERDHAALNQRQEEIGQRANQLADRYLDKNVSWIGEKLTSNNFATCKQRLLKVVEECRGIGFEIPEDREQSLLQDLKKNFEEAVRREFAREEQGRIKAQIREEEKLQREIQKQIQEAEREQAAIKAALEKALQKAEDEHSAEVEHLRAKLKEAEEKCQRAISQAQITKAGHVYVLSNIGSFGDGIFKVGMTRRLEPLDRVGELSSASVPFPFDVHMMISCDDAPTLENALHREFHKRRLNKVNLRKEFFRVDLESIRKVVETLHGEVDYVADPEALQYRDTLNMTDEDYEFVEQTVQSVMDEEDVSIADD
jgi:hypothetical protein